MSDINYLELEQLKATLVLSNTVFADEDLQLALGAASRSIDAATGRRFWLDEDATSVRYYTPTLSSMVRIDDLVALTSLRVSSSFDGSFDQTWTDGSEFLLEPLNAPSENPPRPWEQITLRANGFSSSGYRPSFNTDLYRSVELTGQFGWLTVPDEIRTATSLIAVRLVKRMREAPFGVAAVGVDGFALRISRTDPDVAALLGPYCRKTLLV
jgi:hypothetical protein